jgi:tetratricopeptide (TPR) repeat protein
LPTQTEYLVKRISIALCLVLLAGACSTPLKQQSSALPIALPTPALPLVLALPNYPLSVQDRPTTDGLAYLNNLNARLATAPATATPHSRAVQAGVLYQRFQALGALDDLDQAYALAQGLSTDPQTDNDALLLSATIFSYLHEFDAALALLDRLSDAQSGAALRLEIANARILSTLAARTFPNALLTTGKEYAELVQLANACIDRGELACASDYFHQAQFVYTDVAPLPLAWLHTQQGIALLRFDQAELAIPFFRSALVRLPGYSLALEHLAQCLVRTGEFAEARTLYLQAIEQTQNPEDMAGLAILENQQGNAAAAQKWLIRAKMRYAERLKIFPAAYAQHAVKFYLLIGEQAEATRLAQLNFALRKDAGAYITLAEVGFAAGNKAAACELLAPVIASGRRPPELLALQNKLGQCVLER